MSSNADQPEGAPKRTQAVTTTAVKTALDSRVIARVGRINATAHTSRKPCCPCSEVCTAPGSSRSKHAAPARQTMLNNEPERRIAEPPAARHSPRMQNRTIESSRNRVRDTKMRASQQHIAAKSSRATRSN
ncbi:MAG: hypothetical protein KBF94_17440 [Ilumatobacteraceae bacterium]|nr:hypothetical protein [Ilumatobacteraceae bacterium]